jgi:hypothetical protein
MGERQNCALRRPNHLQAIINIERKKSANALRDLVQADNLIAMHQVGYTLDATGKPRKFMSDEVVLIKSRVQGVKFENTGKEIIIRFDGAERIDANELNLIWDEFMFWTKVVTNPKRDSPVPA